VTSLLDFVAERPEQSIAVVSHWGVLRALTGVEFDNCELRSVELETLLSRPRPAAAVAAD
jgi:broad specificity phosphatase PhoE